MTWPPMTENAMRASISLETAVTGMFYDTFAWNWYPDRIMCAGDGTPIIARGQGLVKRPLRELNLTSLIYRRTISRRGSAISTVFTGVSGYPFETMVFRGPLSHDTIRSQTFEQAARAHETMVARVEKSESRFHITCASAAGLIRGISQRRSDLHIERLTWHEDGDGEFISDVAG